MALYSVRLECSVEGNAGADKFYLARVEASGDGAFIVVTTHGRIGTAGVRMESDPHATLKEAVRAADFLASKKLAKGYKAVAMGEVDGGDGGGRGAAGGAGGAPPAKKARKADAPAADKPSSKAAKAATPFSPMLAAAYDGSQNIEGWVMSEKLDGIRAIYHPDDTRKGPFCFASCARAPASRFSRRRSSWRASPPT